MLGQYQVLLKVLRSFFNASSFLSNSFKRFSGNSLSGNHQRSIKVSIIEGNLCDAVGTGEY
jgi:hypothetical protein